MRSHAAGKTRSRRSTSTAACLSTLTSLNKNPRSLISANNDSNQMTYIVNDTGDKNPEYKNWRTLQHVMNGNNPHNEIRVSLSAQPNILGWHQLALDIDTLTHNTAKRKIVLDLRQENHGFINGYAISLSTSQSTSHANQSIPLLEKSENVLLQESCKKGAIRLITPKQFREQDFNNFISISAPFTTQDEKSTVEMQGFEYVRIPVRDMFIPTNKEVDAFINLVKQLKHDDWLHIHCKAGLGRTSTFAAMYLMLKNTDQLSLDEIVKILAALPPHYNLDPTCNTGSESYDYRIAKYNLLVRFYDFTQDILHNNYSGNWSTWLADSRKKEENQLSLSMI